MRSIIKIRFLCSKRLRKTRSKYLTQIPDVRDNELNWNTKDGNVINKMRYAMGVSALLITCGFLHRGNDRLSPFALFFSYLYLNTQGYDGR